MISNLTLENVLLYDILYGSYFIMGDRIYSPDHIKVSRIINEMASLAINECSLDKINDYLYFETLERTYGFSLWQKGYMEGLLNEICKIYDGVIIDDSYGVRPQQCMHWHNDSEDKYLKPARENYVLSDNAKKFFSNSAWVYGKQEKSTYNKNRRKA